MAAQEAVIRDATAELQRTRTEMGELRKAAEPPGPTQSERDTEFWKAPTKVITELIQSELTRTVSPLNDRLIRTEAEATADRMEAQLKTEYGDEAWAAMKPAVNQFLTGARSKGVEIDDNVIGVAALNAYGAYHKGLLATKPTPATTPSPNTPVTTTPPHMRPSVATIPGRVEEKPALRDLTENEERLRKERERSIGKPFPKEEFLAWIDVPASGVIHSQLGKVAPKT